MKRSLSILLSVALLFAFIPTALAAKEPKFVVQPEYDDITLFYDGLAFVLKDDLWGLIDDKGNVVVEPQYDDLYGEYYEFYEGMARVSKDWAWGFIDNTGKEVIPTRYDWVSNFKEGLAAVLIDEKMGFINKSGNVVIPPIFDDVTVFDNGVAVVIDDYETGKISLIDKLGKKITDTNYFSESLMYEGNIFNEGVFWVSNSDGLVGAIDRSGRTVIDLKYEYAGDVLNGAMSYEFSEGAAIVGKNLQRSIIDTKGAELARLTKYDGNSSFYAGVFIEGLAPISVDNKWGYIDKTGKEIVAPYYEWVYSFNEGLAPVYLDGKFGFIDKTGKEIVKPQYEDVGFLVNGRAAVRKDGKWGFIDATGKEVIKPQYEDWYLQYFSAYMFEEGLAFVLKGDYFGYIDVNGKEIIPFKYDNAWYFDGGLAAVNVNEKWGVISMPVDEPSAWAKAEVEASIALGLVSANMQNGFEDNITRADFSKLVVNLLTVKHGNTVDALLAHYGKTIDASVFTDTKDETILAANALGIVGGKGKGLFDPNGSITRQEAAAMLTRAAKLLGLESGTTAGKFADDAKISDWAKESVAFVASAKDKTNEAFIMGGTGDNKFSPAGTYTRQQAFITMKRLFNAL